MEQGTVTVIFAVFGLMLTVMGIVQTFSMFILSDIRDRLVRLEDRAMDEATQLKAKGARA